MKNVFLGITIAIFLLCGNAFAQTDDEKAVIALMTNVGKAWEAGDLNKFGEYLTEDCVHIDPFGSQVRGRAAIKTKLQWVIDNFYQKEKPKVEISEYSAVFVQPNVALLTYLRKEQTESARETVVVTKVKNDWKVASFQHIMVAEPPKAKTN